MKSFEKDLPLDNDESRNGEFASENIKRYHMENNTSKKATTDRSMIYLGILAVLLAPTIIGAIIVVMVMMLKGKNTDECFINSDNTGIDYSAHNKIGTEFGLGAHYGLGDLSGTSLDSMFRHN